MLKDIQQQIIRLKQEKNICILAHCYQSEEILEVADFIGDSFGLSQQAANASQQTVVMCGVRFMAETVKILAPQKTVLIPKGDAGCPMAEQVSPDALKALKAEYPDHAVVAYINTTAALKTLCDVCVTSASAVKIIRRMPEEKILFVPDCNLGSFVQAQIPEKSFTFIKGGCPVHTQMSKADVEQARAAHPDAKLLVHPECLPEVVGLADYAGSTTGIMDYAAKSEHKSFIIGTENSIVQHLQFAHPDKAFYPLSKDCLCHDMKLTTLMDVLRTLEGIDGEEIRMDDVTIEKARHCIDRMLELGKDE